MVMRKVKVKHILILLCVSGVIVHLLSTGGEADRSTGQVTGKPKAWFMKAPELPKYIYLQDWMEGLMTGTLGGVKETFVLFSFLLLDRTCSRSYRDAGAEHNGFHEGG